MPKVSVIVPVYNVEEYIEKCLETLVNQTLDDIEIIIVNDGSNDNSKEKINKYIEKYGKKIVYLEKENGGLSDARNYGIPYAKGEYIAFVDSDDYIELNTYEKMYELAKKENSDMVECDFIWEYPNKKKVDIGQIYNGKHEMLEKIRVVAWNKLIKREIVQDNKIEFPKGLRYEDLEFTYKLIPFLNKVSFLKMPCIHYIQRENSISNTQNERTKEIFVVLDNILNYYKEKNLYDEYSLELEYLYTRILLCSSLKRMRGIPDEKVRSKLIDETWEKLNTKFPNWKKNKILKKNKSLKNLYMKLMNKVTYTIFNKGFSLENILCLFVIMCPFLDMASFLFRNIANTSFSPSTFIRPIIPIAVIMYLFFKKEKKLKLLLVGSVYFIYALIHIYIFSKIKTLSSYSNEIHELQYIINYSFMILNLFIYTTIFNKENQNKLRKSVLISAGIYIASIFIAIITNTSSSTYIEKMGQKGWFESGNSICAILLLSIFAYIPLIKDKRYKLITFIITALIGIFLSLLVGTRVGLYGFILTIAIYVCSEIFQGLVVNKKIEKKFLIIGATSLILIVGTVVIFGSNTLQRRKHLQDIEQNIVDESKNEQSHITGSLLEIKEKIEKNELEDGYMNETQKQSIMDLYNIANEWNIKNNDQRMQQLVYNFVLVKNQANPILILFGNGYMANYRELVFEMEVPAILINFGIIGFMLYLAPFIWILISSLYKWLKETKKYDSEFVRLFLGCGFAFALSLLSGYTFFNQSSALIIVVLYTLLKNKKYK